MGTRATGVQHTSVFVHGRMDVQRHVQHQLHDIGSHLHVGQLTRRRTHACALSPQHELRVWPPGDVICGHGAGVHGRVIVPQRVRTIIAQLPNDLRARALARSHCTLRTSAASSCSRRRRRSSCPLPAVLSRRLAPEPASMDPNQAPMPWRIRHAAQPSHAASSYTNTRQEGVHLGRLGFQKCCA